MELLSDEERILKVLKSREASKSRDRERVDAQLSRVLAQQQTIKTEQARVLDAYAKGKIDLEQLGMSNEAAKKQLETLEQQKVELQARVQDWERWKASDAALRRYAVAAKHSLPYLTFEDRREYLLALELRGAIDGRAKTLTITGVLKDSPINDLLQDSPLVLSLCEEHARPIQRVAKRAHRLGIGQ